MLFVSVIATAGMPWARVNPANFLIRIAPSSNEYSV
jgi:hypothetical protein